MNNSERALEDEEARLAAASLATGDPTGWFDRLYAAGAAGRVPLPWSRREPHPLLTEWAQCHHLAGEGKRAIVPGCGLGADAEYLAGLGFTTTAFDISPTAIRLARHRHPDSPVEYVTADLLHLPRPWLRAFDLVAEIITVQALPRAVRHQATTSVARLTAPGGTLLVIAAVHDSTGDPQPGPPWPLTRAELDEFAAGGLTPAAIEITTVPDASGERRWRAAFHRRR
jgi:ubiquinone/menaquinone biosynthesis C-methylase UbiE